MDIGLEDLFGPLYMRKSHQSSKLDWNQTFAFSLDKQYRAHSKRSEASGRKTVKWVDLCSRSLHFKNNREYSKPS